MSEKRTFPCSGCGSMMEFDPSAQQLRCPACGSMTPIPADRNAVIMEYPIEEAERNAPTDWSSATATVKCGGCGTQTVVQADSGTAECPFCGSRQLIRDAQPNTIRPESLIPFSIPRDDAKARFKAWIRKKWLAPDDVRKSSRSDKINGVYVPYWTYDAQTDYDYAAEAGTHYYVTEYRTRTDSNGKQVREAVQVQKTSWRPVFGSGDRFFDDIAVNASRSESRRQMEKLADFAFSGLVPYRPEFLLGFMAERYSVSVTEGFEMACGVIRSALNQDVRNAIMADEVRNIRLDVRYRNVRFKHLLAPIWLSSFPYGKKVYRFVINGQTGTVKGDYPKSPWKVALLILIGLAAVAVVFFLIRYLQSRGG
jgi:DNA-directed RNA polymerase subunit RPC12/RpoP